MRRANGSGQAAVIGKKSKSSPASGDLSFALGMPSNLQYYHRRTRKGVWELLGSPAPRETCPKALRNAWGKSGGDVAPTTGRSIRAGEPVRGRELGRAHSSGIPALRKPAK